jgi:ABC-type nitrate/sulfonate/bicarbonate transport system permease component
LTKRLASIGNRLIPWMFFGIIILLWEFIVAHQVIARYILPSPTDILKTLLHIFPDIKIHLAITLSEAFLGLFLSIILAGLLAIIMDTISIIKKAIYPILIVSQTIPIIALAPLFALWFGFGELSKIIVVILVCFFPIIISLVDGLDSVDPDMLNLLKSMGANRLQIFKLLKLPASMVNLFSGLRIAATYSIMGAVIGEWLGGESGLGVYMMRVKHSYALDKVFAVILIIVVASIALFKVISVAQNWLMPWQGQLNKNQTEAGKNE